MISEILRTEFFSQTKSVNQIKPIVSVCVLTYNHEKYIGDCLDSILKQKTNFPYEIIIGEDNSEDATRQICIEYAERYPDKIRLFLRTPDQKFVYKNTRTFHFNFIANLLVARGNFIATCDGDDYWIDSQKLQYQVDFLRSNLAFSGITHWHSKMKAIDKQDFDFIQIYKNVYLGKSSSFMFKSFELNDGDINLIKSCGSGDTPLLHMVANRGLIRLDCKEVLFYREHNQSYWSSMAKIDKAVVQLEQAQKIGRYFSVPMYLRARRYRVYLKLIARGYREKGALFKALFWELQYRFWIIFRFINF